MVEGWNLHNHLTIKKSFEIMGQGVMGFGVWGSNFNMVWGLGFGVFMHGLGFWFLGFEGLGFAVGGLLSEIWGLGFRVLWFGVCACYLDVGFVIVVWIFVMAHGWNLHNHLTIKKSFEIMGQGVMGFGG
jgi:hypothetical protein